MAGRHPGKLHSRSGKVSYYKFKCTKILAGGNAGEGVANVELPQLLLHLRHLLARCHHLPPGRWVAVDKTAAAVQKIEKKINEPRV